jgi:UMF1 family MFS transporter
MNQTSTVNNPKIMNAWCMYDWANSVFPLTITSAIFPIYWESQTKGGVSILGMQLEGSVLFSYCLSFAFLIIAFINPILCGIADNAGNKKTFMKAFVYIGAISCFGMYFFDKNHVWIGVLTFVFGTIGYAGSIVFYNAFLPEIATEDKFDKLSAKGFSMGYIGGVLLLIVNLIFILKPELIFDIHGKANDLINSNTLLSNEDAFKMSRSFYEGEASKLAFLTVGVWWILFSLIPFYYLPNGHQSGVKISIKKGYLELMKVFAQVKKFTLMKRYLTAFFFYSMGVQTVMYVASLFGVKELQLPKENLIITILLIQLIAIGGAYIFSHISIKYGNIRS